MYEIFNWGSSGPTGPCTKEPRPKRLQLSIIGNEINIDDPPTPQQSHQHRQSHSSTSATNFHYNYKPGMGSNFLNFLHIKNTFPNFFLLILKIRLFLI